MDFSVVTGPLPGDAHQLDVPSVFPQKQPCPGKLIKSLTATWFTDKEYDEFPIEVIVRHDFPRKLEDFFCDYERVCRVTDRIRASYSSVGC